MTNLAIQKKIIQYKKGKKNIVIADFSRLYISIGFNICCFGYYGITTGLLHEENKKALNPLINKDFNAFYW